MHGYLCSATMEIFMNQDKIMRDLSPIPSYVRNPSSLYVTDMPSDAPGPMHSCSRPSSLTPWHAGIL